MITCEDIISLLYRATGGEVSRDNITRFLGNISIPREEAKESSEPHWIEFMENEYGGPPFVESVKNLRTALEENDIGTACIEYITLRSLSRGYWSRFCTAEEEGRGIEWLNERLFDRCFTFAEFGAAAILRHKLRTDPNYFLAEPISSESTLNRQERIELRKQALKALYPYHLGDIL